MESASLSNGRTEQGMKPRGFFHMAETSPLLLRYSWSWQHCHHCWGTALYLSQQQTWNSRGGHVWNRRCLGCAQLQTPSAASARLFKNHHPPHTQSLGQFNEKKQRGRLAVHFKEINSQILPLAPQQGRLQQYSLNKFLLFALPPHHLFLSCCHTILSICACHCF